MHILLDTKVLIWALSNPAKLDPRTQMLLRSAENKVAFSAASIWEIAIKSRLGRTDFRVRPEQVVQEARDIGFTELAIHAAVAVRVADLPQHHGDPFDRLLVVQAMAGPMQLFTSDATLQRYSELVMLVG